LVKLTRLIDFSALPQGKSGYLISIVSVLLFYLLLDADFHKQSYNPPFSSFEGKKKISKNINTYPRTGSPTSKLRPRNNEAQNPHHFAHLHLPAVAITS
jgi:hypothetical protein